MFILKPVIKRHIKDENLIAKIDEIDSNKGNADSLAVSILQKNGVDFNWIISMMEKYYSVKYLELKNTSIDLDFFSKFDINFLIKNKILPIKEDESYFYFSICNLINQKLIDQLKDISVKNNKELKICYSFLEEIEEKLKETEQKLKTSQQEATKNIQNSGEFDASIFIERIIGEGIKLKASDIHIEAKGNEIQVRYRIDGILEEKKIYKLNDSDISAIMVRTKIISGMDISEKRKPQDGRIIDFKVNNQLYDLRVSSVNTIGGEKIVFRIFEKNSKPLTFEDLGFNNNVIEKIKTILENKNGIIYLAGATGSGKTTTLYAMIDHINSEKINIYSIEDPVEKTIPSINQIQIDPLSGIDYHNTLKALLRQDPDVIVVGEIRDEETANLSIRSSLTGHLVISTIHANNAIDSISRLIDMEIEPYLISASSLAFMSQRLVRRLCPHCKVKKDKFTTKEKMWMNGLLEKYNAKNEDIDYSNIYTVDETKTCPHCRNGYSGRTAIIEVLEVTDEIKNEIKQKSNTSKILEVAIKNGFEPLELVAIKEVLKGTTSIEEAMREL